jgi:hypothetical protein
MGAGCDAPVDPSSPDQGPKLNLNVIFTSLTGTRAAIRAALELAGGLGARVTVLIAQVVPYPLPLECPPVPVWFTESTLWEMLVGQEVDSAIRIYLCRDRAETIRRTLSPDSLVVIGKRKRWWFTAEQVLAWMLRRDGHHVILADADTLRVPEFRATQLAGSQTGRRNQ